MRLTLKLQDNAWAITPTDGDFAGTPVAIAEGLTLEDATFFGKCITGTITAAWGLTILEDDITGSPEMVRALGIGQTFNSPADIPFIFDDEIFRCAETMRPMRHASHVLLLNQGRFYGK